jgi:hypothetical protein
MIICLGLDDRLVPGMVFCLVMRRIDILSDHQTHANKARDETERCSFTLKSTCQTEAFHEWAIRRRQLSLSRGPAGYSFLLMAVQSGLKVM